MAPGSGLIDKDFLRDNEGKLRLSHSLYETRPCFADQRVQIVLKSVGNAPTLVENKRKMVLKRSNSLFILQKFLRQKLGIAENDCLVSSEAI